MTLGRPKQFDREQALEKAMELFWARGYEATGLRDLTEHMGIGRQSLYDTFGDKHDLFVQAFKHYNQCVTQKLVDQLKTTGSPLNNVRRAVKSIADTVSDRNCRGCLLTNTLIELAPRDAEVAAVTHSVLSRMESAFRQALKRAVNEGELPATADVRALARFLTSTVQGLVVMGKASSSRATVRDIVNVALSVLG